MENKKKWSDKVLKITFVARCLDCLRPRRLGHCVCVCGWQTVSCVSMWCGVYSGVIFSAVTVVVFFPLHFPESSAGFSVGEVGGTVEGL